jgi:hypothetical protein
MMARRIEELNTSLIIKSSKEHRENRQYAKIDRSKPHSLFHLCCTKHLSSLAKAAIQ